MAIIKVGDISYEATLTRQRDTLTITQLTDKTLEMLEAEFSPEVATEIRVSKKDGPTEAIYKNLDILNMQLKKDKATSSRWVSVTMRIEQITQSEADALRELVELQRETISAQAAEIKELRNRIETVASSAEELNMAQLAIEEGVADA